MFRKLYCIFVIANEAKRNDAFSEAAAHRKVSAIASLHFITLAMTNEIFLLKPLFIGSKCLDYPLVIFPSKSSRDNQGESHTFP